MHFLVSEIKNVGRIEREIVGEAQEILGEPPQDVHFRHPLHIHALAVATGSDILVNGKIKTTLDFTCGRCREEFLKEYEANFQQVFSGDQKEISIANDVQEAVFVDLPLIPVCNDACKGLCSVCGKNKNLIECGCAKPVETRWSALKDFRIIKK